MVHFGQYWGALQAKTGVVPAPGRSSLALALLLAFTALLWIRELRLRRRERRALLERRERELAALQALAAHAGHAASLRETLYVAVEALQELFGEQHEVAIFDFAGGETFLGRGGESDLAATASTPAELPSEDFERTEFRAAIAQSLAAVGGSLRQYMESQHMEAQRAALVTESDLEQLPAEVVCRMREAGCKSWMAVALHARERIAGVLLIAGTGEGRFHPGDSEFLRVIARQLGNSIEQILSLQESEKAGQTLRDAQEKLLQSEKMSAVGLLIAGVAHELNNPLTAILGYAQLMEGEKLSGRAQDFLAKLHRQAQRTQRVVQNLLCFSRPPRLMHSQVDLRRVLDAALMLREFDLKLQNITVETHCDDNLPMILGDEHQLEQVFLNIIGNAVDAILEAGNRGVLSIHLQSQENRVCVEFRDNGTGVREPAKIFDPFYTTKKIGKGSGLGLSICYGIVHEHGGDILAVNHPGGGASFFLNFPAAATVESSDLGSATRNPAC